ARAHHPASTRRNRTSAPADSDSVGCSGGGAADRLCQCRRAADRSRRRACAGVRHAARAGRRPRRDRSSTADRERGARAVRRRAMVVVEVAIGVVLLVGAGLLIRTLDHLLRRRAGFDGTHVMRATLSLDDARYRTAARVNQLFAGARDTVAPDMQRAVQSIDPMLSFAKFRTLDDVREEAVAAERAQAVLLGAFAALALLLAAVGLYGLVASSVAERRRELAIRMALGATERQAVIAAAAPGLVLAVIGVSIGVVG